MSKYKKFIATVDENLRVINQELFDIFSIMQMNGTHAGMITERIEWAHGKLKGITELHEQALEEAEDMKAKVKAYLFSTNFDEERELYLELCILTKGSESK